MTMVAMTMTINNYRSSLIMSHKSLTVLKSKDCNYGSICDSTFDVFDRAINNVNKSSNDIITKFKLVEPYIVNLWRCLLKNESDPDIRMIKLASIISLYPHVILSDKSSIRPYIGHYCAFYYTSIYQTYMTSTLMGKGRVKYDKLNSLSYAYMMHGYDNMSKEQQLILEPYIVKEEFNNMFSVIHFLNFMKSKYSYVKGNHTLIDFMNSYSGWTKDAIKEDTHSLPPIYTDAYQRGCNCICGTTAICNMLRILSTRERISAPPDYYLVIDHTSEESCHIFLRYKDINFETTNDTLVIEAMTPIGIIDHLIKIIAASTNIQIQLDVGKAYSVVDAKHLDKIIISEHVQRNSYAFSFWHETGYLDDPSQDLSVIGRWGVSAAETFTRLLRLIKSFRGSSHLWKVVDEHMRNVIGRGLRMYIGKDVASNVTYSGHTAPEAAKKLCNYLSTLKSKDMNIVKLHLALKSVVDC